MRANPWASATVGLPLCILLFLILLARAFDFGWTLFNLRYYFYLLQNLIELTLIIWELIITGDASVLHPEYFITGPASPHSLVSIFFSSLRLLFILLFIFTRSFILELSDFFLILSWRDLELMFTSLLFLCFCWIISWRYLRLRLLGCSYLTNWLSCGWTCTHIRLFYRWCSGFLLQTLLILGLLYSLRNIWWKFLGLGCFNPLFSECIKFKDEFLHLEPKLFWYDNIRVVKVIWFIANETCLFM